MDLFDDISSGAEFSRNRKYRYALWRIWDKDKPLIMWIGLNPSYADESMDDRTINRIKQFSHDWGFGGCYMTNLYAFITPYPDELVKCKDPEGENDLWLERISQKCERIVFCWGSHRMAREKGLLVAETYRGYTLGTNSDNSPRHPLYVKRGTTLKIYEPGE
jgi:hypothetical protein